MATVAVLAGGCGTLQLNTTTPTDVTSPTTVTSPTMAASETPLATVVVTSTPTPGLTDTGYKAPDGSPLYAECIGVSPVTGAKLALPPDYPKPAASQAPAPTNAFTVPTVARPPDADLPTFDVLSVHPSDPSQWIRVTTPCVGGLSFGVPPGWTASHDFAVGGYQQDASAMFLSADGSVKVDLVFSYSPIDRLAQSANGIQGNGSSYPLATNVPVTIGGAPGISNVSSDIIESRSRYVTVGYLVSPRTNWYLSIAAFFNAPYQQPSFADLYGLVNSLRFQP